MKMETKRRDPILVAIKIAWEGDKLNPFKKFS